MLKEMLPLLPEVVKGLVLDLQQHLQEKEATW